MRRPAAVLLAFVLSLGAVGCGADEDPTVDMPAGSGDTTTTASEPSTSTTAGDSEPITGGAFGTERFEQPAGGRIGLLTDVRHAEHDDFYRVVFEFDGDVPGVKVGYTQRPVVQDGSGDEITIAGDEVLLVQFEPASGFDTEASKETYTGPKRLEVEQAPVVEIVRVSDFEAHLDWAIGVDADTGFRVDTLESPSRVVIDLRPVADA